MTIWTLIQIMLDLAFVAGFVVIGLRLRRPPQDDPRLSRGLQLLQTKITILEDLSDRTDQQFKQLNGILEAKTRHLQDKILQAEQQLMKIDHSMNKSLEVAEIFQDKIPHEEILERQRTIEYVKAARMAHSGVGVDDIAAQVNLPREQVELIAKFNRDQLMFDETQLPDWAKKAVEESGFGLGNMDFVQSLESQPTDLSNLQKLEKEFKDAVETAKHNAENLPSLSLPNIQMPNISMPNISMPNIPLPNIDTSGAREQIAKSVAPAMAGLKSTAETIKQKLVATAEDLLVAGGAKSSGGSGTGSSSRGTSGFLMDNTDSTGNANESTITAKVRAKTEAPIVKKVIFPRIEKDS